MMYGVGRAMPSRAEHTAARCCLFSVLLKNVMPCDDDSPSHKTLREDTF